MGLALLVIGGIAAIAILVVIYLVFGGSSSGASPEYQSNLRNLVMAQRVARAEGPGADIGSKQSIEKQNLALAAAVESSLSAKKTGTTSAMTLEKQLRYAKWPITPLQFRGIQLFFAVLAFLPMYVNATIFLQFLALIIPGAMVRSFLEWQINKRFEAFDNDYPVLLLSYVSMLKTGMNAIQGLHAAAKGLPDESLVRAEVELLVERLRLGLTEEQAIGAFAEDVAHPELELFVQSLILSKRVGGALSHTLERLAKQVRKRQQFRKQAVAVVGMERSSTWAIGAIMTALMVYLGFMSPELVGGAFTHPIGQKVFQAGIMMIVLGFWWMRKVTEIKI